MHYKCTNDVSGILARVGSQYSWLDARSDWTGVLRMGACKPRSYVTPFASIFQHKILFAQAWISRKKNLKFTLIFSQIAFLETNSVYSRQSRVFTHCLIWCKRSFRQWAILWLWRRRRRWRCFLLFNAIFWIYTSTWVYYRGDSNFISVWVRKGT